MITVVHLITKLEMGGAQENTLYTVEHLDRRRFRVALLHGPGGYYDDFASQLADTDVEVVPELVREVKPRVDAVCVAALVRALRRRRAEHAALGHDPRRFVVHTHSSKAGILGRFAARAAGVPKIVHTIHGFGFHPAQRAAKIAAFVGAEIAASQVTDAFISVSRANLAEGIARGIVDPTRQHTAVIRSGFALEPFRRAAGLRAEARAALGLCADDEVVVSIANLKPQKDPLVMVEAIRLLAIEHPRVVCLYAGDGELRPRVEAAIAHAGLQDRFRLLGWREDVPELLAAADVVALASIFEGLPRTAVQALAAERPFVGTRVDGTPEVIREGKNGYLVEPRDARALAAALAKALEARPVDPDDRARVEEWDADLMVRRQEALYEALVGV
ncbi:glycosyltransferase [Myxococcota bacterium]|nr:glycosyltransferase [Myxococcota bacterium]